MKIRKLKKDYAVTCNDISILKYALKHRKESSLNEKLLRACNKSNLSIGNKYHRKHKGRIKFR